MVNLNEYIITLKLKYIIHQLFKLEQLIGKK